MSSSRRPTRKAPRGSTINYSNPSVILRTRQVQKLREELKQIEEEQARLEQKRVQLLKQMGEELAQGNGEWDLASFDDFLFDLNKRNSRAHGGTRKRYRLARRSRK